MYAVKICRCLPGSGASADEAIKQLNHDYQIYKSVEQQLLHKKTRLLAKVPDLHRALDMVKMLKAKAGDEVGFCSPRTSVLVLSFLSVKAQAVHSLLHLVL